MPDQPKKPITIEDIQRELGPEKMSFMSEMLRPDAEDEREEDANWPSGAGPQTPPEHTPEEARAIVEGLEKYFGRKPTPQEINLALKEARWF